ncbi:AMP-dependent synthetase/ligase [Chitinophaga solisilvae]|uniref:Long-chain fatty acid--CoA ligase n=1 Tax=Chitinophaga solisilvae TaxID=1233460 RepID=A0A3S1CZ82_9BACT|nr:long-chain fatty acid--CoA ligase [Chitinophaga solisilvae]NSL86848.1 long-chain fatty acid--CoA ligase [Chitinophaga solisilvae]
MKRLFDMAAAQATGRPDGVMLASKKNGEWVPLTCKEVNRHAADLAAGLLQLGLHQGELVPEKQDKIALVSQNRPEWLICDLAVQQTGAILTPIYPTISPVEFAVILNEAEVRILFLASKELYDRFQPAFKDIPTLKYIYTFDDVPGVENWSALKGNAAGEALRKTMTERVSEDTIATIIYTSGTTGVPKGVMLSHKNIVSNVLSSMPAFSFARKDDRCLSFLPLNHIFEKMVTYIYVQAGIGIYYAESMDTIGDNLREVKPMVFTSVPRLLEKVYERIISKGLELKGIKRALFFWAVNLGKQYDNISQGSFFYRLQLKLANKLIFNKWREALGGRVVAIVSGSAALQERLIRIFSAANITIMEGYGLTETSPVISVNRLESEDRRIGTVGPLIDGVEVKLAEDGEIICRGPNIMVGYYKKPEQTAEVLTPDGWFHTGDIGVWVEKRFLKITDRKKEVFKTSGGKYVAPQAIENKMRESPYIEQMMVVGPGRKFVSALIVPNYGQVRSRLSAQGIQPPASNEDLVALDATVQLIQEQLDKYNPLFGHVEQVKKFLLLPAEWTIDNGILTPKLSIRRKVIEQRFEKEIDSLYGGSSTIE